MNDLFTIGYSPHTLDSFLSILKKYQISALADVRSSPYSQFKPEFNKNSLKDFLKEHKIAYVFLGDHCGARVEDPSCYVNGKVDYKLVAENQKFKEGLERIKKGLENFRIALMCAEKDPVSCHRMILICRSLLKSDDINIIHIIDFKNVLTQSECEARLLKLFKLDQPEFFRDVNDQIAEAYERQAEKIAYVAETAADYTEDNEGSINE